MVMGECILIIEDEERHLRAWDFVHCPPGAAHMFVGAGDRPCVLICAGNRDMDDDTFWRVYRRSDVALRHGASVERETSSAPRRTPRSATAGVSSARSCGASSPGARPEKGSSGAPNGRDSTGSIAALRVEQLLPGIAAVVAVSAAGGLAERAEAPGGAARWLAPGSRPFGSSHRGIAAHAASVVVWVQVSHARGTRRALVRERPETLHTGRVAVRRSAGPPGSRGAASTSAACAHSTGYHLRFPRSALRGVTSGASRRVPVIAARGTDGRPPGETVQSEDRALTSTARSVPLVSTHISIEPSDGYYVNGAGDRLQVTAGHVVSFFFFSGTNSPCGAGPGKQRVGI